MTDQAKKRPRQVAAYQSLRLVTVDEAATCGAQIGVNLLLPDGKVGTIATLAKLFGSTGTITSDSGISTTDDLEEGQWHYWFTDRRAQDAVGGILANSATIDLAYVAGTLITATLNDLADSGTGAALVKITRDSKGRISGTGEATTTDLTEGSNLYFTTERAQDAVGAALDGTGNVPLTYDDAGNKISAALSAGVLTSLALADSAAQPGDLATVATTGNYSDLSGLPTLGTAAATDAADYATAAQGATADSAVQSVVAGTNVTVDNTDPQNPVISATGGGGSGDVVGPASATDGALALFDGTTGKLLKDGGALNKAAVGLGAADNTSDASKPVSTAQQAALDALIPPGYIDGLKMVWVSGTALTVTTGAAYIPSLSKVLRASSDIAKSSLSLTASTWYHVYLYDNAGTPDVEIVTTAPAAAYSGTARTKTGDTSRRYVGSVRIDASSNILSFYHEAAVGSVHYRVDLNTTGFRLVSSGTSTSDATVAASGVVPVTARTMLAFAENSDTASGIVFIGNADGGTPAATHILAFIRASRTLYGELQLTSSQSFTYMVQTTGIFNCYCAGYRYER